MVKPPDQGGKKPDHGRKVVVVLFILFTTVFGLVAGRQRLEQKESQLAPPVTVPESPDDSTQPPAPDSTLPSVGRQSKPKGWVDLKTDDLGEILTLPGMTRARAVRVLELRQSKPDLKLNDLLLVPGITQDDLDLWQEHIWEGA